MFRHCRQNESPSLTARIASARRSTSSRSAFKTWNANRCAVFWPIPVLAPSPFAPASPALASEYFPYCRTGSSFLNLLLARHRSDLCKLCAEHLQRLLDDRMRPRLLEEDQPLLFFLRRSELRHRRSWGIGLRRFDNPQPNRLPAQSFTHRRKRRNIVGLLDHRPGHRRLLGKSYCHDIALHAHEPTHLQEGRNIGKCTGYFLLKLVPIERHRNASVVSRRRCHSHRNLHLTGSARGPDVRRIRREASCRHCILDSSRLRRHRSGLCRSRRLRRSRWRGERWICRTSRRDRLTRAHWSRLRWACRLI